MKGGVMKVKITWRNNFPFQDDPQDLEKHTEKEYSDESSFNEIETHAVLDTPEGYFLFKIELPKVMYRYDKNGHRKTLNKQ